MSAAEQPIACTLTSADERNERLDDWAGLLATAVGREEIEGGVRVRFAAGPDAAARVARLAAAEIDCCGWLELTLHIESDATILEIHAPADGQAVLLSMFGTAC